jgi:hypothetical protein
MTVEETIALARTLIDTCEPQSARRTAPDTPPPREGRGRFLRS